MKLTRIDTCSLRLFSILVLQGFASSGKELNVPQVKFTAQQWKPSRVTNPNLSGNDYVVFFFNKIFGQSEVPAQYIISISADNKYSFFINCQKACAGPQREIPEVLWGTLIANGKTIVLKPGMKVIP